jgi:hypothetical protein
MFHNSPPIDHSRSSSIPEQFTPQQGKVEPSSSVHPSSGPVKPPPDSVLTKDGRPPTAKLVSRRHLNGISPPTGVHETWTKPSGNSHPRRILSSTSSTSQTSPITEKASEPPEDMPADPPPDDPPPGTPPPDPPPTGSAPPPDDKNDAVLIDATLSDLKTHYETVKIWADYQGRLSQGLGELSQDMVQNVSRVEGHH